MRQLNDQERALTEKNVKRNQEELKTLQDNLAYNMALITRQLEARDFDDKWRNYLREQKDKEDKQFIQAILNEIDNREDIIKICNDQLNNGVEEKSMPGVN